MWRWAKRWADWVRNDVLPLVLTRRGGHAVHIRYEAAGRPHAEVPVPWAADAVVVEVTLRLPPAARRKSDFALRFPLSGPIPADSIRPEADDRFRVAFRFAVPRVTAAGEVLWKLRPVAPVCVPVLTADAFLSALTLSNPTVSARLARQVVPVRAFAAAGCRGLTASAVVRSPHRLAPAADLGLSVEFRSERSGRSFVVPVPLPTEQRGATEALVTAACPCRPRGAGWWSVTWRIGDRVLAGSRVEALETGRFEDGVRLLDSRFAAADRSGPARMLRVAPAPGAFERVGPCFLVAGGEPGAAGVCRFGVFAVSPGNPHPRQLLEQGVLVTDAPTVFAPGLVDAADLVRVSGFELRLNGRVLGVAALSPVPPATLTAEGGFKPPRDFAWTPAAEDELQERLGRLGGG